MASDHADTLQTSGDTTTTVVAQAAAVESATPSASTVWGTLISSNALYPSIDLVKPEYVIGRHRVCDIRLQGENISNKHCRVFRADNAGHVSVLLEDISRHGTFVNGHKISTHHKCTLHHLDQIQFAIGQEYAVTDQDVAFVFHDPQQDKLHPAVSGSRAIKRRLQDHYTLVKELGSGNFATVMLGVDMATGDKYAIKIINKTKFWSNPKFFESIEREVAIMMEIQHPNLVRIVDFFDEEDKLYLVLELMAGGELFDRIIDKGKFNEEQSRRLFRQMLLGVKYLHERGIVHRDLKPENLLLVSHDDDLPLKISDFGLARVVGEHSFMDTICGTPNYLAPDVFKRTGYSKAVDMWSLGVILYIILCGFPPFSEERKTSLTQQIEAADYDFPSPWWDAINPLAKDLISHLIVVDPSKRLTVQQALEHPWMQLGSVTLSQALQQAPPPVSVAETIPMALPAIVVQRPTLTPSKEVHDYELRDQSKTRTMSATSGILEASTSMQVDPCPSVPAPIQVSTRTTRRSAGTGRASTEVSMNEVATPPSRRTASKRTGTDGGASRKRRK